MFYALLGVIVLCVLISMALYRLPASGKAQTFEYGSKQVILTTTPRTVFEFMLGNTAVWMDGAPDFFYFGRKDAQKIYEACGSYGDGIVCKVQFTAQPLYFGGYALQSWLGLPKHGDNGQRLFAIMG